VCVVTRGCTVPLARGAPPLPPQTKQHVAWHAVAAGRSKGKGRIKGQGRRSPHACPARIIRDPTSSAAIEHLVARVSSALVNQHTHAGDAHPFEPSWPPPGSPTLGQRCCDHMRRHPTWTWRARRHLASDTLTPAASQNVWVPPGACPCFNKRFRTVQLLALAHDHEAPFRFPADSHACPWCASGHHPPALGSCPSAPP